MAGLLKRARESSASKMASGKAGTQGKQVNVPWQAARTTVVGVGNLDEELTEPGGLAATGVRG